MIEIEKPRIETEEMNDSYGRFVVEPLGAWVRHYARQLAKADPPFVSSGCCGDGGPHRRRFA